MSQKDATRPQGLYILSAEQNTSPCSEKLSVVDRLTAVILTNRPPTPHPTLQSDGFGSQVADLHRGPLRGTISERFVTKVCWAPNSGIMPSEGDTIRETGEGKGDTRSDFQGRTLFLANAV